MDVLYDVIICMLCMLCLFLCNKNYEYKVREKVNNEKNKLLHNYCEELKAGDIEIRRFRHDYKNHIIGILYYLNEEKYDDLRMYMEAISEDCKNSLKFVDVGHAFVNALLNHYYCEAEKYHIALDIRGDILMVTGINDYDWSIIIPNMLSNAIEATKKVKTEDRIIKVNFKYLQNKIMISVSNPTTEDVIISEIDNIKTSKKDKLNHGFGIRNIKKCVEKYHGGISCTMEAERQFNIVVWMEK